MPKKQPKSPDTQPVGFEDTLARLEAIVERLEGRQSGLDESLAHYEEGVRLLRHANVLLARAEQRVTLLDRVDATGQAIEQDVEQQERAEDVSVAGGASGGQGESRSGGWAAPFGSDEQETAHNQDSE